jgi:arylsulfatase A-like enzyme
MRRGLLCALGLALSLLAPGCRDDGPARPLNFVLFVLDTTRADAISADGVYSGTTPAVDALATEGLRYTRAFAQAPWTLPSHASMFTGLLPSEHGVGWRGVSARDELVTLAEQLRDAGYETFGVTENPWVSAAFNLDQGFEQLQLVKNSNGSGVVDAVTQWLGERKSGPFFLFVNVIDAHAPYTVRRESLPDGVSLARARRVPQAPGVYICSQKEMAPRLRVLRALYQGDVAAADAKLGAVMQALRERTADEHTVTFVVADHGEHFGENRLVSHQFSVRNALLHVPLIVHGLPGAKPDVIDQPVALVDLMPSILAWAGLDIPAGVIGRPLPTSGNARAEPRDVSAEYADPTQLVVDSQKARSLLEPVVKMRRKCDAEDRVFGSMRSVIRYPFKLIEYQGHPPELYDLERDPNEEHDLAAQQGERVSELAARLGPLPDLAPVSTESEVDDEILDALEALGYIGNEGTTGSAD